MVVKRSGQGARLAGDVAFPDGRFTGAVEWRTSGQQRVLDSLTIDQIRALGVATAAPYVPPEYGKWDPDPFGFKSSR